MAAHVEPHFAEVLLRACQDGDVSFLERFVTVKHLMPISLDSAILKVLAKMGPPRTHEWWLEHAAPIDPNDLNDALHTSCQAGRTASTAVLLARGANAASVDGRRRTPLMAASDAGSKDMVTLLLRLEVAHQSIDLRDNKGQTALGKACCRLESLGVAGLLLEAGADPMCTTSHPTSPFVKIVLEDWHRHYSIVKARRLRDTTADLDSDSSSPANRRVVPCYLESRSAGHKALPVVRVVTRRRSRRLSTDDAALPAAVATHVLYEMKRELFIEMASM